MVSKKDPHLQVTFVKSCHIPSADVPIGKCSVSLLPRQTPPSIQQPIPLYHLVYFTMEEEEECIYQGTGEEEMH